MANDKGGCKYTLSKSGVITSISLYVNSYETGCKIKVGIYASDGSGGSAKSLEGQTVSNTITQSGWHVWSNLNIPLTAGTYYFYWACSNSFTSRYSGVGNGEYKTGINYNQELWSICQMMSNDLGYGGQSIFANYTPTNP